MADHHDLEGDNTVARKRARIADAAVARILASMRSDGQSSLDLWGVSPRTSEGWAEEIPTRFGPHEDRRPRFTYRSDIPGSLPTGRADDSERPVQRPQTRTEADTPGRGWGSACGPGDASTPWGSRTSVSRANPDPQHVGDLHTRPLSTRVASGFHTRGVGSVHLTSRGETSTLCPSGAPLPTSFQEVRCERH